MNGNLQIFDYENDVVRTAERDGDSWFIASDICRQIGLGNTTAALSRLDQDEKGFITVNTPGGAQNMLAVNESGLYNLVLTSKKEEAKKFKKWVTSEVLPILRKAGRYDASLAKYTPNQIDLIDQDPAVTQMRRLLEVTQEQVLHRHRLDELEQDHDLLVNDLKEVRSEASHALSTAVATRDTVNNRSGWSSALGHARTLGLSIPLPRLAGLGRKLTRRCEEQGVEVEQIRDPRFGFVNIYPESVLNEFNEDFRNLAG